MCNCEDIAPAEIFLRKTADLGKARAAAQALDGNPFLTPEALIGIGGAAAKLAIGAISKAAVPLLGTSFGKLGTVVANPGISIQRLDSGFHFIDSAITRGVSPQTVLNVMRNPDVVLQQRGGLRYLYLNSQGAVAVARNGTAVTTYGAQDFGADVLSILNAAGVK